MAVAEQCRVAEVSNEAALVSNEAALVNKVVDSVSNKADLAIRVEAL